MRSKYQEDTLKGRLFAATNSNASYTVQGYNSQDIGLACNALYNPPGSDVLAELVSADFTYLNSTNAYGALMLMGGPADGNNSSAAGLVTLLTAVGVYYSYLNSFSLRGAIPRCVCFNNCASSLLKVGSAPTVNAPGPTSYGCIRHLGAFNLEAQTGTPHRTNVATYNFDGTIVVPPGVVVWFATGGSTGSVVNSLVWNEVPIPDYDEPPPAE